MGSEMCIRDSLKAFHGKSIHGIPVLDGTAAVGAVINADTIDEEQVLAAGEAPDKGTAMPVGGLLDHDSRGIGKCLRNRAKSLLSKLLCSDGSDGAH